MQVHMPHIPVTILVIDTTAYSGNFERELCGYVAGVWDGETHGEPEANDAIAAGGDVVQRIMAKSMPLPHEEYGIQVPESIRATPGRLNNGMGVHMDADQAPPGMAPWPAYESVAIFLVEPLDAEEMDFVRRRAAEFAAAPMAFGERGRLAGARFGIRDVYQLEHMPGGEERRLP